MVFFRCRFLVPVYEWLTMRRRYVELPLFCRRMHVSRTASSRTRQFADRSFRGQRNIHHTHTHVYLTKQASLPEREKRPRANFHVYRGNVSPLRGKKKTIFEPVSKNNTGMAALRAGLPVMKLVVQSSVNRRRNDSYQN